MRIMRVITFFDSVIEPNTPSMESIISFWFLESLASRVCITLLGAFPFSGWLHISTMHSWRRTSFPRYFTPIRDHFEISKWSFLLVESIVIMAVM